ncbi:cell division protein FtsQ/DivIB [uncultured Alsobacter sp.]|uniref:cell division protein FtsQ/DivIB n=1 Tax=uncultured Alsobacter sp. TaxID=1748258 RepID=UPI0025D0688C|nr:cell division protein FtsQ/DivIB [uncultured Alsobacter sp.]
MLAPVQGRLAWPALMRRRNRPPVRAVERAGSRLPRFLGLGLTAMLFATVGAYGVVRGGQYEEFLALNGDPRDIAARALGFAIGDVQISGVVDMNPTELLQVAGVDPRGSLPFFDAAKARERILAMPLVKEATVRKLYPNALSVTIVEREPYALWQNHGDVFVVSSDGTPIDRFADARFAKLPMVVGEGANKKAAAFVKLLDAAPELRGRVRAGILVGERRWTIKFDNGIDVRLPEEHPGKAFARLSALVRDQKILDRDILSIDLRLPDRVVMRLGEEAATARAEAVKAKAKLTKGGTT